jgi:hypothetical protein
VKALTFTHIRCRAGEYSQALEAAVKALTFTHILCRAGEYSQALEAAVKALTCTYGILVIVASGNTAMDACGVAPANVKDTMTVGKNPLNIVGGRDMVTARPRMTP